jgi:ribosomal protein L7/L12
MHFTTVVKVPTEVIEQIGLELRELMINELRKYQTLFNISNQKLHRIEETYTHVLLEYIKTQQAHCDGYHLTQSEIDDIAQSMDRGHRIAAVKKFREATRAGLTESKNFIMKFSVDYEGALAFKKAFS